MAVPYQNYKNIYQMTLEDSYIYCIAHLIRHFKIAGIMVRDVLDVYLYNEAYKDEFDRKKIQEKLTEFGIEKFEEKIREIAYHWFGEKIDGTFDEVEKFILHGTNEANQVHFRIGENGSKIACLRRLVFPTFSVMKDKYPILEKLPVLLPFTWGARLIQDFFSKEANVGDRLHKVKLIYKAKAEDVQETQEIYEKLGIVRKED